MASGRQRVQPQAANTQNGRIPRLAGKVSPQQSLKRVGPAISEILRTSTRPRPRNEASDKASSRKFRPDSGADAFLYLDERAETDSRSFMHEPDPRAKRQEIVDSRPSSTATMRIVLPSMGRSRSRQGPSARTATPDRRLQAAAAPIRKGRPSGEPSIRDTMHVRLPGLLQRKLSSSRGPRLSKALPSLPRNSPTPRKLSFSQSRRPSIDAFHDNKAKILRGRGVSSPRMDPLPGASNTSGSSYESVEQTWDMINNMMNAVGEDAMKRARAGLGRTSAESMRPAGGGGGGSGSVTFPRATRPRPAREGSSESYSSSGLSGGMSSVRSSPNRSPSRTRVERPEARIARTAPRPRSIALRRGSVASIYSIVIQPTREDSREALDALVTEEDLPSRIRRILHFKRQESESSSASRMSSRSNSVYSDEYGLHPDLSVTLDALRSGAEHELEDVCFESPKEY